MIHAELVTCKPDDLTPRQARWHTLVQAWMLNVRHVSLARSFRRRIGSQAHQRQGYARVGPAPHVLAFVGLRTSVRAAYISGLYDLTPLLLLAGKLPLSYLPRVWRTCRWERCSCLSPGTCYCAASCTTFARPSCTTITPTRPARTMPR